MRRRGCVWLVLTVALVGGALGAQAPTGTITGHVTDAPTRRPVVGVRVTVVGSDRGAVTRDDGGYTLADVPEGAHRVRASRIGFTAQEQTVVVVAGQSVTADFTLSTVAVSLSDVVVVGYGTQRRADLTGAVVSVPPDQIQKAAVVSLQQALQGSVYAAIDEIRNRSNVPNLTPGLSEAQFRDSVWLERRHELYGEFQEWFDLKRQGRWLDIMNDRIPAYPGGATPNASVCRPRQAYQMLLPIPDAEIGANRLITQNPGY